VVVAASVVHTFLQYATDEKNRMLDTTSSVIIELKDFSRSQAVTNTKKCQYLENGAR